MGKLGGLLFILNFSSLIGMVNNFFYKRSIQIDLQRRYNNPLLKSTQQESHLLSMNEYLNLKEKVESMLKLNPSLKVDSTIGVRSNYSQNMLDFSTITD